MDRIYKLRYQTEYENEERGNCVTIGENINKQSRFTMISKHLVLMLMY